MPLLALTSTLQAPRRTFLHPERMARDIPLPPLVQKKKLI